MAFSFYWRSRLPFAGTQASQASKSLNRPLQLSRAIRAVAVFYWRSRLPSARPQTRKPSSGFPGATRPVAFLFYWRRLPFARPRNPQTLCCSSHELLGPRHFLLKLPRATRAVVSFCLVAFKAAVCQASKLRHLRRSLHEQLLCRSISI